MQPEGRHGIALLGRSVCGSVGSPVSYRHTTDGPGWPPIPARTDVAEGVAVDRVAADAAVFDTEAATYYGHGVEHTENLKSEGDGDQHGCESVLHGSYSRSVRDGRSRPSDAGSEAAEALRTSHAEALKTFGRPLPEWDLPEWWAELERRARLSRWQEQR